MKNIQITMGEVESLNERIYNLQEDLKEAESQKKALISQIRAKKLKKVIFSVLGTVFLIIVSFILFTGLDSKDVTIVCLISAVVFWALAFVYLKSGASEQEAKKIVQVEKSISVKQKVLDEYKEKKKELILENERKLNDALKEKITTDFYCEDIYEEKECPMCAETVKAKARICRYCGYKFE